MGEGTWWVVKARFWFLGEWSMGVFVSNWGRHIAMEARFVSKVSVLESVKPLDFVKVS